MSSSTRIGMVRCEHCGRQFNPHSAARHIPWCEKQKQERNKHRLSNEKRQALERYKWRISYRPSNHLQGHLHNQQAKTSLRRQGSTEFNGKLKKSSINSSATLSSPSASSSASLSTTSANDTSYHQQRVSQNSGQNRRRRPLVRQESPPTTTNQLQRSISSLTLTKRQGLARIPEPSGASSPKVGHSFDAQTKMRTKSTNDLSNMGEMVETLARRVEEIFAQNQLLLASIPKGSGPQLVRPGRTTPEPDDSDECDNGLETVKCHHCKADCLDEANYCHKCGCKIRITSPLSPI